MKEAKNKVSSFYIFVIKAVNLTNKIAFHSHEIKMALGMDKIHVHHPTIVLANHVEERDVPAITSIWDYMQPKMKYYIPIRKDLMEKNFLIKEFKPKGPKKMLLHFVDMTNLIPFWFKTIGGFPIARPFRDNAKELMKSGALRDLVNEQWEGLAEGIQSGRNMFLFPEGTFTEDGRVMNVKKGTFLLHQKIPQIKYFPVTFTYDLLTNKKSDITVHLGNPYQVPGDADERMYMEQLRNSLAMGIVLTPGNLFSFLAFTPQFRQGIEESQLVLMTEKYLLQLKKENRITFSQTLEKESIATLFNGLTKSAIKEGFMTLEANKIRGTEKLYSGSEGKNPYGKKLKKMNPYLFHKNQLSFFQGNLESVWETIQ